MKYSMKMIILFLSVFLINISMSVYAGRVEDLEAEMEKQKQLMEQLRIEKIKAIETEKQKAKIEQNLARLNDRLLIAKRDLAAAQKLENDSRDEKTTLKLDSEKAQKAQGPVKDSLADMLDERTQLKKLIDEKQKQYDDLDLKIGAQKQRLAQFNDLREAAEKRSVVLDAENVVNKEKINEAETRVAGIEKEMAAERQKMRGIS